MSTNGQNMGLYTSIITASCMELGAAADCTEPTTKHFVVMILLEAFYIQLLFFSLESNSTLIAISVKADVDE